MPALINYGGDNKFCSPKHVHRMDLYTPPAKRARIIFPLSLSIKEDRTPSIDTLPEECLFEILRRISEGQTRSASTCVSKRWLMLLSSIRNSEICRSKHIKSNINKSIDVDMEVEMVTRSLEGKKATDIRLAAIAVGTSSRGGLGKLYVKGNKSCGVTNNGLFSIAHGCPSLRVLSLWNVHLIGDEGIAEIAKECPLLEKLDLSQCPLISDKGLIKIAENYMV